MPKVSEDYVKSRRRQVLDGAAASFAAKGYHAATMDDICERAGLSKGAVYGYFASKEDIVAALKVESVQRDAAVVRAAMQRREPEQAFEAMLDWVAGGAGMDSRRLADIQSWAQALLNQRLLDTQLIESQLWVDALELLAQEAQRRGSITDRLQILDHIVKHTMTQLAQCFPILRIERALIDLAIDSLLSHIHPDRLIYLDGWIDITGNCGNRNSQIGCEASWTIADVTLRSACQVMSRNLCMS